MPTTVHSKKRQQTSSKNQLHAFPELRTTVAIVKTAGRARCVLHETLKLALSNYLGLREFSDNYGGTVRLVRDFSHWSLVIGHWSLVIGHWSLVIGVYVFHNRDKSD